MAVYDDNEKSTVAANSVATGQVTNNIDAYEASARFVEEVTSNCDEIQEKVLAKILSQNAETEYLKRHGMVHGCLNRETFKKNVPIITYENIKSDIQRMYSGDSSPILCARPITELWRSSGTSEGQEKLFPATDDEKHRRNNLLASVMPFIKRRIEGPKPYKGKAFSLIITRAESVKPGALLIRSGMNSVFKDSRFYNDKPYPYNSNTSPIEAIHCSDPFQSVYTQLLCGFYQRLDVTHVKAVFGSNLLWAINFLKSHHSEICHDISSGTLSPRINDPPLRNYIINTFMQNPKPDLAMIIEQACNIGENWEGSLKKIWPNAKYIETVVTGSMAQYISMLNYYSGGLPLVSVKYSSSECDLGFNLNPMCDPSDVSYTIFPNMAYYEFLPVESSDVEPKTVDMANVEVGKEYELLVTTYAGLYRYRLGDVLTPTGFYNSTPQFKFVRRRNVLLSVDIVKTTEVELQNAIDSASSVLRPFDTKVIEYTSYSDVKNIPGHYVIYAELMTIIGEKRLGQEVLEQCCSAMEGSLGIYYRGCRIDGSVGPIEIRVVSNGTFDALKDYAISKGASFLQYKVPRCVKLVPMLELLDSRVVSTHFSPTVPPPRP